MIYPDTDPQSFSLKHGVPLVIKKCKNCGKEVDVNVPIISKDFVGFESKVHEPCGTKFKISHVKPTSGNHFP
jgi:hypothetical protein